MPVTGTNRGQPTPTELQQEIEKVKADKAQLETQINELKTKTDNIKADMDKVKVDVEGVKQKQKAL